MSLFEQRESTTTAKPPTALAIHHGVEEDLVRSAQRQLDAFEMQAVAIGGAVKDTTARAYPKSSSAVQLELGDAVVGDAVARAIIGDGACFRIQPGHAAGRTASPNGPVFGFQHVADFIAVDSFALGPGAPVGFAVGADMQPIQSKIGADPQVVVSVAPDGPDGIVRKPFARGPTLPLLITEPARDAKS